MTRSRSPLYFCFFLSGASALIYEIVWQRLLTLVIGVSTISIAAVLAAFLAGLALGARLFGPMVDRARNPLRLYAAIEIGIAAAGLLSVLIIDPLMGVFTSLHRAWEPGWFLSNLIRFALAFAAYGLPSVLIGATVPAMARLISQSVGSIELGFGRFYAVNTAGSVLGAALAGFLLIPRIGVQASLFTAAAGNVIVAALATLLSFRFSASQISNLKSQISDSQEGNRQQATGNSDDPTAQSAIGNPLFSAPSASSLRALRGFSSLPIRNPQSAIALPLAALAGAAALAYEVAWMRLMAVYTLNSVYVFTMVVTVYLAALSVGAALAARALRSARLPAAYWLVIVQITLAVTAPLTLALAPAAAALNLDQPALTESGIFTREYLLALAMVFAPTLLIGMTLPLLAAMMGGGTEHAGERVGRLYAWNAVGTIAGAALTGVVLIPLVGIRGTMLLLAACNLLIAATASHNAPHIAPHIPRLGSLPGFAAAGVVLVLAFVPGAARFYRPSGHKDERILYYAEGPSATVHVAEISDEGPVHRRLYVDSEGVAGTYPEIVFDQKMLAHLPLLLLHPAPRRALTVGFGTGGTSYSMLQHGVRVDCVEIEPRVPDASGLFLSENGGLVGPNQDRLNFRLIYDDARAWLHVAAEPYDVIVTDVTSIQYRGNGNLYTVEYFELMKGCLAPGGLACAWVPITGVTPEQLKILIRSFQQVYAHTSVWYVLNMATDFVILVGSEGPLPIDVERMRRGMNRPLVAKDLARIGITDMRHLLVCLLLAGPDVDAYAGAGALHTDDHPVLDYLTHASRYQPTLGENLAEMLAHRTDPCAMDGGENVEDCRAWSEAARHVLAGHVYSVSRSPGQRGKASGEYSLGEEALGGYSLRYKVPSH